jgi:hypothetical protein
MTMLDAIHEADSGSRTKELQALQLALIATVPSVRISLLALVLNAVREIIVSVEDSNIRRSLVEALQLELLNNIGDEQKEFAMRWWYEHRDELLGIFMEEQQAADNKVNSRL